MLRRQARSDVTATESAVVGGGAVAAGGAPGAYWVWLGGLTWTMLGTQVLSFGMVWAATDFGAGLASLVLMAVIAPRVFFSLIGGALADQLGAGRVMVVSDGVMAVLMTTFAALLLWNEPSPVLLLVAAGSLGLADAFYQPSSAAIPKFLVPREALPRAMAARQLVQYATGFAGPVLGGVVVSVAGLGPSFAVGAVGYLGMLLVLALLRKRLPFQPLAAPGPTLVAQAREGVKLVLSSPMLRAIVGLTGSFAAFIVPVAPLLIPLLARARGLDASLAGVAAGAFAASMAAVALAVMWRHGFRRAGVAAAAGMIVAGAGVTVMAVAPDPATIVVCASVAGLGTGLFTTHAGPLFISTVDRAHVSRAQAVLLLAQSAPLLLANPAIGLLAESISITAVILVWGASAMGTGIVALGVGAIRQSLRPGAQHPMSTDLPGKRP